ncbi:hypothetical protein ACI2OX_01450 [Bacillus sp. N9]
MESWKQALWLVKFECKAYKKSMFSILLIYVASLLVLVYSLESDIEPLDDLFFVSIFWFMFYFTRPKEMQLQKMSGEFWGVPYFVVLKQLPIPKDVLIKSRFLQYYITSVPAHLFILILLFISSTMLRDALSFGNIFHFPLFG